MAKKKAKKKEQTLWIILGLGLLGAVVLFNYVA